MNLRAGLLVAVWLLCCAARTAGDQCPVPVLPELPFPFPDRTDAQMATVADSIQSAFEFRPRIRGPYDLRQLDWISKYGEVQSETGTRVREDFLPESAVIRLRAVMDESTEVYFYESFMESEGVILGGESGYVVIRDGHIILKLELTRV